MRTADLAHPPYEYPAVLTDERAHVNDPQIDFNFRPQARGVMPSDNQCSFGWVPEGSFGVQSSTIGCSHPALSGYCGCPLAQGACPKFKTLKNSF